MCHSPQTFLWSPRPSPQVKTEFFFLNSSCNLSLLARSVSYTQSTSNNLGEGEQSLFGDAPEPDSFVLHKTWRDTRGLKSHSTLLMQMWQPTTSYLEAVIHLHTWARTSAQMRVWYCWWHYSREGEDSSKSPGYSHSMGTETKLGDKLEWGIQPLNKWIFAAKKQP